MDICQVCGLPIHVGEFPCILTPRPHGRVVSEYGKGFEARLDVGLGKYVTGWGDVHQGMREQHLDYRDKMSAGDLNARRDRIEHQKREARR